MSKQIWLLAAALAACTNSHGPQEGTQTGNPPLLDRGKVTLEVSADEVHVTGKPGAATPAGATIEITNLTTGEVTEEMAEADGSFDVRVDGSPNDTFVARAVANGDQSPPVYVVRGGAQIPDGGPPSCDAGQCASQLSCEEHTQRAHAILSAAIAAADTRCERNSDCVVVPRANLCQLQCGAISIAASAKSQLDAVVISSGACEVPQGCPIGSIACDAIGYLSRCEAGQCTQPSTVPDGGVSDCTTCFTEPLTWGSAGPSTPYYTLSELVPCAHYMYHRVAGDPSVPVLSCERDLVACNSIASTGAIMSALGHADVQRALGERARFGISPPDGGSFIVRYGELSIEVWDSCTPPSCVLPPGVAALVQLLQDIDDFMLTTEECADFSR